MYLFGSDYAPAIEIESGIHRYDFMCQLPYLIPASLETSYGHIRYEIEAVIDVPWRFDKQFKLEFSVVRLDDLNELPHLKFSCQSQTVVHFCCFLCKPGPLTMTAFIPFSGYTPGQDINFTVLYSNASSITVMATKIYLKRLVKFNRY